MKLRKCMSVSSLLRIFMTNGCLILSDDFFPSSVDLILWLSSLDYCYYDLFFLIWKAIHFYWLTYSKFTHNLNKTFQSLLYNLWSKYRLQAFGNILVLVIQWSEKCDIYGLQNRESSYLVNKDVHSLHHLSGKGYMYFSWVSVKISWLLPCQLKFMTSSYCCYKNTSGFQWAAIFISIKNHWHNYLKFRLSVLL